MTQDTIPTGQLSLTDWQDELKVLAVRAEQLGTDCSLESRLAVASDWFRLLWLSCDPAWIARSCRLASRLCEPVMAMPAGVDEQVVASWDARQAALKSVGALQELPPGPVAKPELIGQRPGRPARPKPEQAPVPAGWEGEPAPASEPAPEPVQRGWGADAVNVSDLDHLWDPKATPLFTVKPPEWVATYLPRYCQSVSDRADSDCRGLALTVRELQREGFWQRIFPDWETCCQALFKRPAAWVEQVVEGVRVLHAQGHQGEIPREQAGELVEPAPKPAPTQQQMANVPPLPRDPNLLTVAEVASAVGMSVSWVHRQLRLQQLLEGVHYRRRQPGEPRGLMFHKDVTMQALQQLLPAKRQLAEQVLAELQASSNGDGWDD